MSLATEFAPEETNTVEDALVLLNAALGTSVAMASHIDGEAYTVVGIDDRIDTGLEVGVELETSETLCHCVAEPPVETEVIPNIGDDERVAGLPAHETIGLEAYLGVPLFADDAFYGVLVASQPTPREFTDEDVRHAKTVAKLTESVL